MVSALALALASMAGGTAGSEDAAPKPISAYAEGYWYWEPKADDTVLVIGSVDVKNIHIEARYNYENFRTASVFLGRNFDVRLWDPLELTITPMIGVVLGRTRGAAPGLEIEAKLWKLELTSESEFVWDGETPDASFLYNWSELTIRPVSFLRAGFVLQRTRFLERTTVDPGALVGFDIGPIRLAAYSFEPWNADRFYAFAIGGGF
ncbi:hypothetical protein AKJ09_08202 [Labilithrix luteola]|uniref:Bacterial surface antigen (D15) domain-containing protein n=1 Tax=Labilithrix luteola TaxID=1391654 RepID=A0A0K1Q738_9BACT|nr:hypothetical protein [Labilithrix luteola]AKV01539.1 hypothetical protein AKJ09_08202 [Labilithrix luteola]